MRVLVVRPRAGADATARRLALRGHAALAVPLLAIEVGVAEPPAGAPAGLAVTSANAVPALSGRRERFGRVPLFAVGDRTAAALTAAGFAVTATAPDGAALGRAIAAALPPGSLVLHVAGRDRRPEPERMLRQAGLAISVWETYAAAEAVPTLPDAIAAALAGDDLDAALHYSRRSAQILVRMTGEAGLTDALQRLVHICLSDEVARGLSGLKPTEIEIAAAPTEDVLFAALDRISGHGPDRRARRTARRDASDGTNPPGHASRTAQDFRQDFRQDVRHDSRQDDRPTMSDTRGSDPLRRSPPTIDLKVQEVRGQEPRPGQDSGPGQPPRAGQDPGPGPSPAAEAATAVEPVAATGLGREPFPRATDKPDEPKPGSSTAGESTSAKPKPGEPTTSPAKDVPEPASKAGPVPGMSQPAKPSAAPDQTTSGGKIGGGTLQAGTPQAVTPKVAATQGPATGGTPASAAAPGAKPAGAGALGASAKPSGPSVAAATSSGPVAATGDSKPTPAAKTASGPDAKATDSRSDVAKPNGPSTVPAGSSGPGFGRLLGAGLVGGLVGAGLAAGASHLLPQTVDPAVGDRIAAVERRVAALPTGNPAASIEPRLAALESGLKQAADEAKAARAGAEAAAKQAADATSRPAADPAVAQRLDALAGRVEEGAKQTSAAAAVAGALGPRVDALGTRVQEGLAAGTAAVGAVGASLRGVETDLGTLKTGTAALDARSADAERRLVALSGTVGGLSTELGKLSPAAVQAGLRIVVAGRLDDALRSGAPLGPALAALAKLGIDAEALAPLRPFAEAAPPSASALAAEFQPLAATMTAVPAEPSESFVDKARRLLGKVVTVRAVGDGSGTDLPGIVAGIESALARGALPDAATGWDRLPDPARRSSAGWADRLKGRVAAEAAARRIGTRSLTALDAATR